MMVHNKSPEIKLARRLGAAFLASIVVGMGTAALISHGIDVNLTADISETASNMQEAELRLRGKAYIALISFMISAFIVIGLYVLLKPAGKLLASWSLLVGAAAALMVAFGAVYMMNAAMIVANAGFESISGADRKMVTSLQVASDYSSFHLSLILSSLSNAGFFYLFLIAQSIPRFIAAWGLMASLFVATALLLRDFIAPLGSDVVTYAFMAGNLAALLMTGLYLLIRGIRAV